MISKTVIHLASQSPRRSQLIRKVGYVCRVIESTYVEKHEPRAQPKVLVIKHAKGKLADARIPKGARFVVAADTVVALKGKVYGKPTSLDHAVRMLHTLSGNTHDVYTGWAVRDLKLGKTAVRCIRSRVTIRSLSKKEIQIYFKKMNPLDKAGSYAVQSKPSVVDSIQGSYSNVMGLPMEDFTKTLNRFLKLKSNESK